MAVSVEYFSDSRAAALADGYQHPVCMVGCRIKITRHLAALVCVLFYFVIQLLPAFAWMNSIS